MAEMIEQLLKQTDKQYNAFVHTARQSRAYYANESEILKTGAAAIDEVNGYLKKLGKNPLKSADNRIPTNWHKVFVDQKTGYLFTYPPQFDTENSERDKELLKKIVETLGGQYEKVVKQLCIDSSNTGVAWLIYWYGNKKPFDYYFIDPLQIRVIYDSESIKPKIRYVIRQYIIEENGKSITCCDLWDDKQVICYRKVDNGDSYKQKEIITHDYGRVPFICFKNNSDGVSDLKMYKAIIDSIDKIYSGFINDIDDLQEIIWVIKNYAGQASDIAYTEDGEGVIREIDLKQKLKAEKYAFVDEKGGIDTIRSEVPYEARSKALELLFEQMFVSAMAVNPNPERTGQATGTYIEFLYSLLELKAGLLETEFRSALDELVKAVLKYLNYDENVEVEQMWTRNKPRNDVEIVNMLTTTPSEIMSDETKTKEHPLVDNWSLERDRIAKEQKELGGNRFEEDAQS